VPRRGAERRSAQRPTPYLDLARVHQGTDYDPLGQVVFSLQAQLVATEAFRQLNGFDESYIWAEFTEFFLRFVRREGLDQVSAAAVEGYRYRRRPGSMSSFRRKLQRDRRKALRAYIEEAVCPDGEVDVGHLGRSPVTGAQHYQLLTPDGAIVPPYRDDFFPVDALGNSRPTSKDDDAPTGQLPRVRA
jgi:hypothetical protein